MKRIIALLTLATCILATTGCRTYSYVHTSPWGERQEVWINSIGSDTAIQELKLQTGQGSIELKGFSQQLNEEAINSIGEAAGNAVGAALRKAVTPTP